MKLPRDVDADELIKALRVLGYSPTRQTGSHIRVTTQIKGQHHEVVPRHCPIKPAPCVAFWARSRNTMA